MRFFLIVLIAIPVLATSVHFLHAFQMQRISSVFLMNAQKSAAAGERQDAIRFASQYLNFHPKDLEARVLLATELAAVAETPREILNFLLISEGILRADPKRSELRSQVVAFYLRLGKHQDALVHLANLLQGRPADPELLLQTAKCHEAIGESDKAAATYRNLIRLTPQDARVYERLAYLLRDQLDQPEAADQLIQELMDSNRRNALAYCVRASYRQRYSELKHAARDARIAYQLDPRNPDILRLVGTITIDQLQAGQQPDFPASEVRANLERLLAKDPDDKTAINALIDLDLADGRPAQAEARLRKTLKENPRDLMARFQLADLLLVTQRVEESKREVKRIQERGVTWQAVNFLEARILMVQKRWLEAIRILETVHLNPREDPDLASSVYQQLGQCYEQIGHHHRRLKAYGDAVKANPHSAEAHLGLASALARMGRVDEALNEYQLLRGDPLASLAMAQLRLLKQLMLPPAERQWNEVDAALVQAVREKADIDQTLRLRVMLLVAQDQTEPARKLLQQERNKRPDALPVWLLSAQLENWAGQAEAAAELLKTAKTRFENSVKLHLAELRLKTRQPNANNADWILGQLEAWDDLPENVRVPALGNLADGLENAAPDPKESLKLRLEMAALTPDHLGVWRKVLPSAFAAKNEEAVKRAIGEIRRIEGETGPYWRLAEADRLLMHARRGEAGFDRPAQTLLKKLRNEMPADWTIPLRLAEIAERQGETAQAIGFYQAVLNLEMYHPQVVKRLVVLLSSKGRDPEAEGVLTKLQQIRPRSFGPRYGRVAAVVALRSQHRIRALELAREAVAANSKNPKDHLWLGQILNAIGMMQEAETALRKSVELDPRKRPARRLGSTFRENQTSERSPRRNSGTAKTSSARKGRAPVGLLF